LADERQIAIVQNCVESTRRVAKTRRMKNLLVAILFAALSISRAASEKAATATDITDAAKAFLAALTPEQAAKAKFDLTNEERMNWHFIPRERKGLTMKDMTPAQDNLAFALLGSTLSQRGFMKATTIMSLEQILLDMEQGRGPKRDPENYFVSIFGEPGSKAWGWRFEGHHMSFNFTLAGDKLASASPNFLGTNPGEVKTGPRAGLRVLGREEDLGRKLVTSLKPDLQKIAIYTNVAPSEIISSTNRPARLISPDGLAASKLNADQKEVLWELVKEYVFRYREDVAREELEKIHATKADKLFFAWAGGLEKGQPHYYRVQGPTFLIEYDNTQNNANHVHAVYRNLENDFGGDMLKRHYDASHSK
jgi:hypothetical protein